MNSAKENKNWKEKIMEDNFFRPSWYSIFINPYFINRRKLYSNIKKFAKDTPDDAHILDVGCGLKPYRDLFSSKNYTGIDIEGGGHSDSAKTVDAYFDGIHIPFHDNSFETVLCTQVLEHAVDPEELVTECSRVLKPNGRIFISMPFMYPEHEIPFDFRRFTKFEHQRLMAENGLKDTKIIKTTGFFGTFGQIFVISIFEGITFRATILKTILSILFFAPIQIKSLLLDLIFFKAGPTMDYVVIAKKEIENSI